MFSTGFTLLSAFFFFYRSPDSSACKAFDSILYNIDEVLSINSFADVFAFGDFNVHHKDCLTCFGVTDRSGELCYNFSILNALLRWLTFLLGPQTLILTVLLF